MNPSEQTAENDNRSTFGRTTPPSGPGTRGLRDAPLPNITDEMLKERETYSHLEGMTPAAPNAPVTDVSISREQAIMLAKHYGLTVIDSEDTHGGVFAELEAKLAAMEQRAKLAEASAAGTLKDLRASQSDLDQANAHILDLEGQVAALKAPSTPQGAN